MTVRTAKRNKFTMYYALAGASIMETDENGDYTGDKTKGYYAPVKFEANISPSSGNAEENPFGSTLDYTRTILTADDLPIVEGTLIWLETNPPEAESDGSTADYRVVRVAPSKNLTKYAVKAIEKER